jgi:hypothetical protein
MDWAVKAFETGLGYGFATIFQYIPNELQKSLFEQASRKGDHAYSLGNGLAVFALDLISLSSSSWPLSPSASNFTFFVIASVFTIVPF